MVLLKLRMAKFSASLCWKTGQKQNNYRSNLAIQIEENFPFNSAAVAVTSALYPSYLIKVSLLKCQHFRVVVAILFVIS